MNKVMLVGFIGKKGVELRYTPGDGKAVANYTIAVPRTFKDKEYDYISCITWNKQAEFLANNQDKIKKVEIEGRLQVRSYDAKDGSKKYVTEVITDNIGVAEWGERTQERVEGMQEAEDTGDIPF